MKTFLPIIQGFLFAALLLSSCNCEEKAISSQDAGSTDADTDTDTDADTDSDAGSDSGSHPIDPELEWIEISAGSFVFGSPLGTPCMGSMTEKEVSVTLTHPFLIAEHELTQKQWAAMALKVPPILPTCDNCPVAFINWFEALEWCNALSRFEGREECYDLSDCTGEVGSACWPGEPDCPQAAADYVCTGKTRKYDSMYDCTGYRLPTGPEWEYAAKAGTTTTTYSGDITTGSGEGCVEDPVLNDIAWYCFNTGYMNGQDPWTPDSLNYLQQVGLKQPNPFGLYDMLGNSREWVDYVSTGFSLEDNEGVQGEVLVDPIGANEAQDGRRDLRGGAYPRNACYVRAGDQSQELGYNRGPGYGFRPVRTLPSTAPDAGTADAGAK